MVKIVTDSTAYLPWHIAEMWGVMVVPLSYVMEGEMYADEFVENLPNCRIHTEKYQIVAKTSQPAVKSFISVFQRLRQEGHEIVAVTLSSRLSGTYSSACVAAKQVDEEHITVVDSLTTVYGMYLMVERAVKMAATGKGREEIARELCEMRSRIGAVLTVETLEPLRRGGRLNVVRQSLSTMLNLKPVLAIADGIIISKGLARGSKGALLDIAKMIPRDAKRIGVMHVAGRERMIELMAIIENIFPGIPIEPWEIGPVIGIHAGAGAVGVAWLK
ncbi:MAG: DegV family protein [Bacillota bacterium]|nr:DegV family protein [Bacillota bacterium]